MTCACGRDNDPKRRFCGECGAFLAPVCRSCDFKNAVGDRFCGGCGDGIAPLVARGASAPKGADRELAGLFHVAPATMTAAELPESGVSQDDVDRLFGVPS